jgi:hypothetical protein
VDPFPFRLFDGLMEAGFDRTLAARFVRDWEKWWSGLERIEWAEYFPPPAPSPWAASRKGIDAGMPPVYLDTEIYFAVARTGDGKFQVECGSFAEIIPALLLPAISDDPALKAPPQIRSINLRGVYDDTLAAADAAGVALGVPFTRPAAVDHAEYIKCREAIAAHRALSSQRVENRTAPGPRPGRKTRKRRALRELA